MSGYSYGEVNYYRSLVHRGGSFVYIECLLWFCSGLGYSRMLRRITIGL